MEPAFNLVFVRIDQGPDRGQANLGTLWHTLLVLVMDRRVMHIGENITMGFECDKLLLDF